MKRLNRGSALALTCVLSAVIVVIGLSFIGLMGLLGGTREVQHAVDSGNLNVAKAALDTPFVLIDAKSNAIRQQLLPLTNKGRVSLRNINKLFVFELMTQANLQSMMLKGKSTPDAVTNTKAVADEIDKIAGELADKLKQRSSFKPAFEGIANQNSMRLLTGNSNRQLALNKHAVAFTNRGGASNIPFDFNQVPANVRSVFQQHEKDWFCKVGGRLYFKGYTDGIKVLDREIHFIPLLEGQDNIASLASDGFPHLISLKTFDEDKDPNKGSGNFRWSNAVPNAFFNQGKIATNDSGKIFTILNSCAVSNDRSINDSPLPHAFIKVNNPRGYNGPSSVQSSDTLFNAELMSGIFLATQAGTNTPVAFSTDQSALRALVAYNKDPISTKPPALSDADGNPVFYTASGNPVDNLQTICNATALGSNCTCTNTLPAPGSAPEGTCSNLLGSFLNAYPHNAQYGGNSEGHQQLLATEQARYQLKLTYHEVIGKWIQLSKMGLTPQQANVPGYFPSINTKFPYYTGLRKFNFSDIQSVLNTPRFMFSSAGTVQDYFDQIALATQPTAFTTKPAQVFGEKTTMSEWDRSNKPDPAILAKENRILDELLERVQEIKPEYKMSDLHKLLSEQSPQLQLETAAYIYLDPNSKEIVLKQAPPPWFLDNAKLSKAAADGLPNPVRSNTYHLLECLVNAPGDTMHDVYFYVNPNYETSALANDELIWTSSTCSNGLLASLEFRNYSYNKGNGDVDFYQPN